MPDYKHNHYVPIWYQDRFFPSDHSGERKLWYLDKKPERCVRNGHAYTRHAMRRLGPANCFEQFDLYTTRLGTWESTEIEQRFFGPIDDNGRAALEHFASFEHPHYENDAFNDLMLFMSTQKLRTPKGLKFLQSQLPKDATHNRVLFELQQLRRVFTALWIESAWVIADASASEVKFLISDHPVTVYNAACFPESKWCKDFNDPSIALSGSHTLYPLGPDKILILTNLSWFRHPYGNPLKERPNPEMMRQAIFDFRKVQIQRLLTRDEVIRINYILKKRALRYVAASRKEWLFPENELGIIAWDKVAARHMLMPDPRSSIFSGIVSFGFAGGGATAFDEYGRRPGQEGFAWQNVNEREWEAFHAFQSEFARLHGPRRRGRSFEFDDLSPEVDTVEEHARDLDDEKKWKKHRYAK